MNRRQGVLSRLTAAALCLALLLIGLTGCTGMKDIVSGAVALGEYPVQIGDVTVSSKPQKAVVLSSSLADVILALGCETQLTAGCEDCTQRNLRDLTKISDHNVQAVVDLTPDLVLLDPDHGDMAPGLRDAGLTVLEIEPAVDREDYERLYSQVSSAFFGGGSGYDKGIATAQDIFTTLDDINRIVPKDKVTTACYLYDLDGHAVTGDMFASTIMSYAGVTNVFQSLRGGTYEFESLRVSNPDVIFCVPGLEADIVSNSRYSELRAVHQGKVFPLEETYMSWQGRTVIMAAYEISANSFPDLTQENTMTVTDPINQIDSQVSSAMEESALEADPTEYETLREGDQNDDVLKMQTRLEELGYLDVEYNGYYGAHTAECVKEFQRVNGLDETGVANSTTLKKLYSSSAKAKNADGESATPSE